MGKYDDKSLAVSKSYLKKSRWDFLERIFFYMIPSAQKRVAWLRKHNKLAFIGEHVHWQPRKYPLDGQRLKIHDNVAIAAEVEFTMHDIIHWVFDGMCGKREFAEYKGCIEIYDNVFVGAGSRILPGVSIGPNAIVAAGSLVNKDVPPGCIVGGVPAKVIGSFDDIYERRRDYTKEIKSAAASNGDGLLWDKFYEKHKDL